MLRQISRTAARIPQSQSRSLASTVLLPKTPEQWKEYTLTQLRNEAKQRGLATGGTKSKLVQRLVTHSQTGERLSTSTESPSSSSISARQRWISTGGSSLAEASGDKFKPRFSRSLDVKIPEAPEPIDEGPVIPFLAQNFDSPPSESASPPQEPPSNAPRVVTVASAATHVGGGPSHAIHEAVDAHALESKSGSQSLGINELLGQLGISLEFDLKDSANDAANEFLKPVASSISIPSIGKDTTNLPVGSFVARDFTSTTMASSFNSRGYRSVGSSRGVRFVSESSQRILDLPTWRRPAESQGAEYEVSAKARRGMATIRFAVSKLLYIRLPTSRRETLEAYCTELLSTEQLARWWPQLSQSDRGLAGNPLVRSLRADAAYFCEAFAEISGRFGSQVVIDKLLPLVIPVIYSWAESGRLANVDDTNAAAATASKGKKAGNALGEARTHHYQEYCRRKTHFETYDDPGLKELGSMVRLRESCVPVYGSNQQLQEFTFYRKYYHLKIVACELAAEAAVKNWHIVESYMETWGLTKPVEPAKEPKPLRERDRTKRGAPNFKSKQ
ncbi:hypothetical protein FRC11_005084 [Ceratobasidium sp. 423]|nr:hypothetical protein FRC11_005084 [Ceratobasidium sp. 423]